MKILKEKIVSVNKLVCSRIDLSPVLYLDQENWEVDERLLTILVAGNFI